MAEKNKLNVAKVRSTNQQGSYHDGEGLYLIITPSLTKNWSFIFQFEGRKCQMGMGSVKNVTLAEARNRRDAAHQLLKIGQNPIEAKKIALAELRKQQLEASRGSVPSFKECAESVIKLRQPEWKSTKHASQFAASLKNYAYPLIGDLPINEITDDHILAILKPIWMKKNETAGRVRSRIESILGWARAKKYRSGDNPARWKDNLEFLLQNPSVVKKVRKQPSLHYKYVPAFVNRLLSMQTSTAAALVTVIFTALRSSEVRLARLNEIDMKDNVWSIPPERVKAPIKDGGTEFPQLVPISSIEIAVMCRFASKSSDLLFPGIKIGKEISEATVRKLIASHGSDYPHFTMHGFRSTFKDWALEKTDLVDKDMLSEAQLGHKLGGQVKLAYLRTTLLERRRLLMQAWLRYCLSQTPQQALVDLGLSLDAVEGFGLPQGVESLSSH
ncbi:MAG: integrase arm-type DNA-binding domain-containing protein [Kordiimonadaceae bacterium]|nr:integrase arm-type DNA-binding domain-containing protein [Kordiimonadaceae bacterium]